MPSPGRLVSHAAAHKIESGALYDHARVALRLPLAHSLQPESEVARVRSLSWSLSGALRSVPGRSIADQ